MKGKALFAVRYGYKEDGVTRFGDLLTRAELYEFTGTTLSEGKENPYGMLPIVEYAMNQERIGIFEEVSGLVESYNKAIGEKANDVDAFAEAYLAVLGAELDDEDVYRIRDDRIINLYGTNNAKEILVQFLAKPTADGSQENLLDRLETLIYQISMVSNISDESYGNSSGTALAYKLQAMSNLALTMDRKMIKSMNKRYKLFCSLSTNVSNSEAWKDIKYKPTRNIPKNILEEAQTAQALEGIASQETQLSVLSIIDNVGDEIEKLKKRKRLGKSR